MDRGLLLGAGLCFLAVGAINFRPLLQAANASDEEKRGVRAAEPGCRGADREHGRRSQQVLNHVQQMNGGELFLS